MAREDPPVAPHTRDFEEERVTVAAAAARERHGLLYVATTHGSNLVRTVTVPSLGKRLFFPVIRLWSLAQTGRARLPPAPVEVTAREVRAREALRLLMNCPVEVLAAVLEYIFG